MFRFVVRRVLSGVLVMWVVTTGVFLLFFATSRDPAARFAGKSATPETLALLRHRMRLDEPLITQYLHFVDRLLHGDLGYSYATRDSVGRMVKEALPVTASLTIGALLLWTSVGLLTGVLSARRPRGAADRGVMLLVLVGLSMPSFIIGLTLLYLLTVKLPLLPETGYVPLEQNPVQWFRHLILPWSTLAVLQSAVYTRLTRGSLLDVLGEDYILTARAKGLSERRVVYAHGLRAALTPLVTQFGGDVAMALSGAIVTESVFGLQGVGQLAVRSMSYGDLPVILAVVLLAALFVVVANIAVDIAYAFLDPRVQYH